MIRWLTIFFLWISLSIPIGLTTPYYVYADDAPSASDSSDDSSSDDDESINLDNMPYVPPFPGGPIKGFYKEDRGDHKHAGIDVGIDDVAIRAPVDGYVWHKNSYNDRYGWGVAYFESMPDENPLHLEIRLLFADLDQQTAGMGEGHVKKGQIIGYVRGFCDPSSGAHVHVNEYKISPTDPHAPYWNYESGNTRDPTALLSLLGCDFTGTDYSGPNAGMIGSDDKVSFDMEVMKTLGDELNKIMKDWSQHAINAVKNITPFALWLLGILCIIDLTLTIILAGMSINPNALFVKVIHYSAIFGLVYAWPHFINDILLGFVTTIGGAVSGDIEISPNVTQPQLLLQKAIYIIGPALEKIGTFGISDWLSNFGSIIAIYLLTFIVMAFYGAAAIAITLTYIEFYISAGLSLISVPFLSWNLAKFIPRGLGGHLISTAIKLLIISVIVGMGALALKDARPVDVFKVPITANESGPTVGGDSGLSSGGYISRGPHKNGHHYNVGAGMASTNEYVNKIKEIATEYHVDPCLALAIAARESGGDNVDDICMPGNGDGIFQVNSRQQGYDPITGKVVLIDDYFPEKYPGRSYKSDPELNIRAGMMILLDKINTNKGAIWPGVRDYNGSDEKDWYLEQVQINFELISGRPASSVGHTGIAAPMLIKYLKLCLALITIAVLVLLLPGRLMRQLGGELQI